MAGIYETGLDKNPANYRPLTPLTFLVRTAQVYPKRTAVVHGEMSYDWATAFERCVRLASALSQRGIGLGDTVALMLPNTPPMWEAHHGVAMTGAVMNPLNYRLDAANIAFILDHGEAKVLITDTEFSEVIKEALSLTKRDLVVIDVDDPQGPGGERLGEIEYEDFLAGGDPAFEWRQVEDEWESYSLLYTSGTTGNPKGVVYSHRGGYMNAVGNIMTWGLGHHPIYLWTLPMFHCNGWCFPWTITAMAGTHVCLRRVAGADIVDSINANGVTHMCGAPIVMQMLLSELGKRNLEVDHTVRMMTAAAPPPASVLRRMAEAGIDVLHVYGLTEVYGPAVVAAWKEEWNSEPVEKQAELKARQGVNYQVLEGLMVADPETLEPVPQDGETMGEVMMRGQIVMKGYLKNQSATDEAFAGGWFHSGDLGVWHPDGYIQLKDRSKDIIISGGENISSIEVEDTLFKHPDVASAAVVARPDEKWGETPCAFVELNEGAEVTAEEIIAFCREKLAHFKCPRHVIFGELPKTSTGKIQKFKLREAAKSV